MRIGNRLLLRIMTLLLAIAMLVPSGLGYTMMPPDGGPPDTGGSVEPPSPPSPPEPPPMPEPPAPKPEPAPPPPTPEPAPSPPADSPPPPDVMKPPVDMPSPTPPADTPPKPPTDMMKPPIDMPTTPPTDMTKPPEGVPPVPPTTMPADMAKPPTGVPTMPPTGVPPVPTVPPNVPTDMTKPPVGVPTMPPTVMPNMPKDIQMNFDPTKGQFTGADGKVIDMNKMIMPGFVNNPTMKFEIPKMENGVLAPVFIENTAMPAKGMPTPPPMTNFAKQELNDIIKMDITGAKVDKTAFTEQFRMMDMAKLQAAGLETLESLYKNVTPDKLDITNPEVQKQMDLVYQERNKALSIGDINQKLKELNKGGTSVLSVSTESLATELAQLEAMKAKGITDPAQAKKIDEAIAKTKDAQISQTRLMAIRQQVGQLTAVKEQLVKQSQGMLTGIAKGGLTFTMEEKQQLEVEIKAAEGGTVADQGAKIKELIEKYATKMASATTNDPVDALKLSTLYQKANDMTKAQEVLSKSLEQNPNDDKVALELASLYKSSNNLSQAAEVLKTALNRDPLPQTQAKLAEITREMGKPDEAKALIEKAMQGLPTSDAVYTEANNIYKAAGDTKDYKTFVNGEKLVFDIPPKAEKGTVLVSVQPLTTALGAEVKFDSKTNKAVITEGKTKIELTAGSKTALVNGVKKTLEVAPKVEKGQLIAPAKFVGENLGEQIDFKADSKMLILMDKK